MTTTIGSLDLTSQSALYDETQYFWFESSSSSAWGAGAHVTLYPESEFTNSSSTNYLKGQNILMNTDGLSIRNGVLPMMTLDNDSLDFNVVDETSGTFTNVATFGETSRMGGENDSYVEISPYKMRYISVEQSPIPSSGNTTFELPYFILEDIRGSSGIATLVASFIGDGDTTEFDVGFSIYDIISVTIDSVETTSYSFVSSASYITFNTAPASGSTIVINYQSRSYLLKQFTFGSRNSSGDVGGLSTSFGENNTASGAYSFAQGSSNMASGKCSHAEGGGTFAINECAHAEGSLTQAKGVCSHSEGNFSVAQGYCSHACGNHTTAMGRCQFVIGECNISDTGASTYPTGSNRYSQYAFIIGNGDYYGDGESNALAVDWQGGVSFYDPSRTFVVQTHSFSVSSISSGSGSGVKSVTLTKAGYYPVAMVGFQTGENDALFTRCRLENRAAGTCTLSYYIRAVGAVSATTGYVDVLWAKYSV